MLYVTPESPPSPRFVLIKNVAGGKTKTKIIVVTIINNIIVITLDGRTIMPSKGITTEITGKDRKKLFWTKHFSFYPFSTSFSGLFTTVYEFRSPLPSKYHDIHMFLSFPFNLLYTRRIQIHILLSIFFSPRARNVVFSLETPMRKSLLIVNFIYGA